jgi:LuxR family maltose regulon positive regulatory protein
VLARLQRRNLFVVPLDDKQRWYRYHHLFGDLLGNLLRKELPLDRIHALHRRASRWYEKQGSPEEAVKHALQALDFERAASLIEQAAKTTMLHGRLNKLLDWLEALPEALLHDRPRLRFCQGWALHLSGRSDAAEQILQDAKKALQTLPPSPDSEALRGEVAALLAGIATLREDMATVIQEAQEALAYLPEHDVISRARVYVALGTACAYDDEMEQATQKWRQARDLALEAGNPFLATAAIEMLAGTQIYHQGRLREAVRTLQQVLDLGTTPEGSRLPFTGTAHALLAEIYLEWNDLDAAASYLEKGIELLQRGGIGYGQVYAYCAKARLERASGNTDGALEALRTARQATEAYPLRHMVIHLAARQVRLRLWLGDVETAARWAQGDPATVKLEILENLPLYLREVQQISLARVCLARGETEKALAILDRLRPQAEAAGLCHPASEISLLKAVALGAQGDTTAALESLERSLSLAEPEGYVRLYLDEGEPVTTLLQQAASRGISPHFVSKLLAAFGVLASPFARPSTSMLVEPLTEREIEVLQLICEGCSNQQIAERLIVTLNTVKKHASNVYAKLEVSSRAQAIIRARELGLY